MRSRPALALSLVLLATSVAGAEDTRTDSAREAFAGGELARGIAGYRALLEASPDDPAADSWAMMVARGLALAGDHDGAASAGRRFLARRPDSPFREKVAFLTARALMRAGREGEATALMTESLERLRTSSRTGLVRRLIEEADDARAGRRSKGPFDGGRDPDPDQALRLYDVARDLGLPAKDRDAILLRMASAAVAAGKPDLALEVLGSRADADALLLRARALLGDDRRTRARETVEALLVGFPRSPHAPVALQLLDDVDHLARLVREYPDHPHAPAAALRRGRIFLADKDAGRAVEAFDLVGRVFHESGEAVTAAFEAAEALADAGRLPAARARFEAFLRDHPTSARRAAARDRLIEVWFDQGRALLADGRLEEAAATWARLRDAYGLSERAPETLLLEARAHDAGIALARIAEILARYPEAAVVPEAMLHAAEVLAGEPGRFAECVTTLRRLVDRHPDSDAAEGAAGWLETMLEEEITVELPAPRAPTEPRTLALKTRNLETLSGRVYRLDPVVYFRKHGDFDGLESIMVDLVEPEARFSHRVEDYEPHRRVEGAIAVPVPGPGAYLVVLEGGSLRATGLLVVSDITLITKDTPTRTLAFVQDSESGRPKAGVRILLRDEDGRVVEADTGADGVSVLEHRRGSEDAAVLAVHGDSIAHDDIGSAPWQSGVRTEVHLATDRTVYRPGDEVRFRVVVRRGAGESFVTPAGETVAFRVEDRAGNLLLDQTALLSEFGTAAARFTLPVDIEPATYEIVTRVGDYGHGEEFLVEAYRKPSLLLDATPARPDFVRGEEVVLDVIARHAFGLPARDLSLRVAVTAEDERDLLRRTVRTDAAGRIRITVPTSPGPDTTLTVWIHATDAAGRATRTTTRVPLPETAFRATLETTRPRCAPGDDVRVDLLALDGRGEPVAVTGAVEVGRKGPRAYATLATLPILAGPDGRGTVVYSPAGPGSYRFRFVARDHRGNPVTAATQVEAIVAEEERLVVLADRSRYAVGDTARVDVSTPVSGHHALLTFEGEDLYGHRVVRLDGARLEIPIVTDFVPDVRLRVALAHGGRLYLGEDRIAVREEIRLAVEPEEDTHGPGELCRIRLRATDARGAPVSAEIAVAVVDEAIFRLHPDRTRDLGATFTPEPRDDDVETGSSLDFSHEGETEEISTDLLAERARRERGDEGPGVLLEEGSLKEAIGPRRKRDRIPEDEPGRGYRGPSGEVPANMRVPGPCEGGMRSPIPGVRRAFEDTAFFRADVVTDADGRAVVEFTLPHDLTTWRITARGATRGNAFGESRATFLTSRPIAIRAGLPRFLREGDAVVAAAVVTNSTGGEQPVQVDLGTGSEMISTSVDVPSGATRRVDWPLVGTTTEDRRLLASAIPAVREAGPGDAVERTLRTHSLGVPFRTGFAGEAGVLEVPGDLVPGTATLTVRLAPSFEAILADALVELDRFPHGCTEQTANRILPALRLDGPIEGTLPPGFRPRVQAAAIRLSALQNHDGLWGWWRYDDPDPTMTAYALLALTRAREAGLRVSAKALEKARKALDPLIAKTTDPDARAFLLLARSRAFRPDLAALAVMFADRDRLSLLGLAHLTLAYEPLGAVGPARVLREDLEVRLRETSSVDPEALGFALAALAGPNGSSSAESHELARTLASRREGHGFGTTRATGAAVLGLARLTRDAGTPAGPARVRVTIDGRTVLDREVRLDGGGPLHVPTENLPARRMTVRVEVDGHPGLFRTTLLEGIARTPPSGSEGLALARTYALVPPAADGMSAQSPVREGSEAHEPDVGVLRVGEAIRVTLRVTNRHGARYLAIVEPLPAGFEPILDEVESGPVTAFERYDDRIVFFLTDPGETGKITYVLAGEMPGRVSVSPAMVYAMYRPRLVAWSASRVLEVLAIDAEIERDPTVGLDAAGLWWTARRERGRDRPIAIACLEALLARYDLIASVRRASRLLLAALREEEGDFEGAARCYDRLLAESVISELSLDDEVRRARVDRAIGRHVEALDALERASRLLLAEDRRAARLLEESEALETAILDRHPVSANLEDAWRARAERHAGAFEAALAAGRDGDPALLEALLEFRVRYPGSPAAPRISYRLARAHLRAGRWAALEREARRLAVRDGPLADDADWFVAFALFAQGRHDAAWDAARASLEREYPGEDGHPAPSEYRRNLVHLRAQVAHIQGRLEEAIGLYREVAAYSVDAREVLRSLTEETLSVRALTQVRTTETPVLEASVRNVGRIALWIHPVDLLIYFSLAKDVEAVGGLDLDGLRPARQVETPVPGHRDRAIHRVSIPLRDLGPGVFLVLARAGADLEERAVVVISDLEARISSHAGGARVLVTNGVTGEPVPGAFVKMAMDGKIIGEGSTDPRGVFEVTGELAGRLSAVARKEGQYAVATD